MKNRPVKLFVQDIYDSMEKILNYVDGVDEQNFFMEELRIKYKDITFHDLRHTFASLLISKNVPIKYIQRQMGHSTIKMTMDTYGHLIPDVHDQAINVLEEIALNNKKIPA